MTSVKWDDGNLLPDDLHNFTEQSPAGFFFKRMMLVN
jgi:hypothetical protein